MAPVRGAGRLSIYKAEQPTLQPVSSRFEVWVTGHPAARLLHATHRCNRSLISQVFGVTTQACLPPLFANTFMHRMAVSSARPVPGAFCSGRRTGPKARVLIGTHRDAVPFSHLTSAPCTSFRGLSSCSIRLPTRLLLPSLTIPLLRVPGGVITRSAVMDEVYEETVEVSAFVDGCGPDHPGFLPHANAEANLKHLEDTLRKLDFQIQENKPYIGDAADPVSSLEHIYEQAQAVNESLAAALSDLGYSDSAAIDGVTPLKEAQGGFVLPVGVQGL